MRYPWVNTALLVFLLAQLLTGFYGMIKPDEVAPVLLWLHGALGYGLVVLLGLKAVIIGDAYRKPRNRGAINRGLFAVLTVLIAVIVVTGYVWSSFGPVHYGGFSLLVIHVLTALGVVALLAWHVLKMGFIFRAAKSHDRRAVLNMGATVLAGLVLWRVSEGARQGLAWPGAQRRHTGSYRWPDANGYFPVTSWLLDNPAPLDAAGWRLRVDGAVAQVVTFDINMLRALGAVERTVLLDCTGGWYAEPTWVGVPLGAVLAQAGVAAGAQAVALSVSVVSATGYTRRFPLSEVENLLLAWGVNGRELGHGHGAPLRLVAPGRRGYEWVKWVVSLRVNTTPANWQLPVPLQ